MDKKYHEITVEAFVQATEDEEKVLQAIENVIGIEIPEGTEIMETEGALGNPIGIISLVFKRKRDIEGILDAFRDREFMKAALVQIDERLDDSLTFHMRLDKQKAYEGDPVLWESGEAIKIRIKPATFPASREKSREILMRIVE